MEKKMEKKMGTRGFEPRSGGLFLEANSLNRP